MKRYIIGIDPGRNNGYAFWNCAVQKFEKLKTFDFWDLINELEQEAVLDRVKEIHIEAPFKNKPLFLKRFDPKSIAKTLKTAQDVGGNKMIAKLIIEKCEQLGFKVIQRQPTKRSYTKVNKEWFNKTTGWNGQSSEHSRDAAMLIFGKK